MAWRESPPTPDMPTRRISPARPASSPASRRARSSPSSPPDPPQGLAVSFNQGSGLGGNGARFDTPGSIAMQPHFKILTLAVDDLDRSLAFYRDGMGLPTEGIIGQEFEHGAVAFFDLANGMKLAVWPSASLEKDATVKATRNRLGAISIGHIV